VDGRGNKVDVFPDVGWETVAVTSDVRGARLVMPEVVIFGLEKIFCLSNGGLELDPALGARELDAFGVDSGVDQPARHGVDSIVAAGVRSAPVTI